MTGRAWFNCDVEIIFNHWERFFSFFHGSYRSFTDAIGAPYWSGSGAFPVYDRLFPCISAWLIKLCFGVSRSVSLLRASELLMLRYVSVLQELVPGVSFTLGIPFSVWVWLRELSSNRGQAYTATRSTSAWDFVLRWMALLVSESLKEYRLYRFPG